MVARLLPVHALLEDRRALADFKNIDDRIRLEQVLAAADRAARHVGGRLDDGFNLGGLFERRAVERVAALVRVEGLLLAADSLGRHGFRDNGSRGQVELEPVALDIGAARVGDHIDIVDANVAKKAVEAFDEIAARLIKGALGEVLQERLQPLRRREGELILGDRSDGDPVAGQRAEQVAQIEVGLLLHGRRDFAGPPVEFVYRHDLALGYVVGQREAGGILRLERENPLLALGGRLARGGIDQAAVHRVSDVVFEQLDPDVVRTRILGGVISQGRARHGFQVAVDVDDARADREHVAGDAHGAAGNNRAFLEELICDLAPLQIDDLLLLVQLRVEQVAVLVVANALVVFGRVESVSRDGHRVFAPCFRS